MVWNTKTIELNFSIHFIKIEQNNIEAKEFNL